MVSDVDEPGGAPGGSLGDAFAAWASANALDEWAYLRPGGKIDPTGDRAERAAVAERVASDPGARRVIW
ncbi:MAG: hypothetical protein R3B46_14260 [Phycisphaerales bacterium]